RQMLARADGAKLFVTTTWGCTYLGHGLRRDVGAGMPEADRVRARWAAAFPDERVGEASETKLVARAFRPTRQAGGRIFPVGRLAWPDRADAARLSRGGLSLGERLLPVFIFCAD